METIKKHLVNTALIGGLAFSLAGESRRVQSTAHEDPTSGTFFAGGINLKSAAEKFYRVDPNGKPAFLRWWPEGTPPEERVLRVSIVSTLPDYMKGNKIPHMLDSISQALLGTTNTLEQSFCAIDERTENILQRFAKDFKKTYGITLEIGKDLENPHISVCASNVKITDPLRQKYLGFASFPPGSDDSTFATQKGWVMLNLPLVKDMGLGDDELYGLISHEFGHAVLGLRHPSELFFGNYQPFTVMGKGRLNFLRFNDGLYAGPLDVMMADTLGHTTPSDTLPGAIYDMEHLSAITKQSNLRQHDGLPSLTINASEKYSLRGTANDDYLDLRKHHAGVLHQSDSELRVPYGILNGTPHTIAARGGDDTIIAPPATDALFAPGQGNNVLLFMYPDVGHPVIHSKGNDRLVLFQDVIRDQKLRVAIDGKDVVLHLGQGNHASSITLKNQMLPQHGVNEITIGNRHKITLANIGVDTYNPHHFWTKEFPEFVKAAKHTTGFSVNQLRWMENLAISGSGKETHIRLYYRNFDDPNHENPIHTVQLKLGKHNQLVVNDDDGHLDSKLLISTITPQAGVQTLTDYLQSVHDRLNNRTIIAAGTHNATLSLDGLHARYHNIKTRGDDLLITAHNNEGKNSGSLLLKGQLNGHGIKMLDVTDTAGKIIYTQDVSACLTPKQWKIALQQAKAKTLEFYTPSPPPVLIPDSPPIPDHIKREAPLQDKPDPEVLPPLGKSAQASKSWKEALTPKDRQSLPPHHER